jgi:mannose-1-phosphate guanylyltransferase
LKTPRFRAVILAAGLGTRLRPLTLSTPKPLLPVAGQPLLGHTLASLNKHGCEAVAVNLHYQGDKIAARFGSDFEGMPIHYSREETILGTLGALTPLREFLAECELTVVLNGDSLARWPLVKLLKHHCSGGPLATVMVSTRAPVEEFGGGISVGKDGRVLSFLRREPSVGEAAADDKAKRRVFAGAHAFSRGLLARAPEPPSDFVRDLYQPLLQQGERIDAVESSSAWFDIGTPRRYLDGVIGWSKGSGWSRRSWRNVEVEVDSTARIKRSVLEAGATVEADVEVRRSLIMSGATIGRGGRVAGSIIGPAVQLPPGTVVENRLVTEARADTPPDENASIVGGLVYGPLG